MLRPSTPLSVLFFAAFALLLIAVLSTPIVEAIKLAEVDGVSFGVLGFCRSNGCSPMGIGYEDGKETQKKHKCLNALFASEIEALLTNFQASSTALTLILKCLIL